MTAHTIAGAPVVLVGAVAPSGLGPLVPALRQIHLRSGTRRSGRAALEGVTRTFDGPGRADR